MTKGFARGERIYLNRRTAGLAVGAKVVKTFKPATLALPVTNLVLDKIQSRRAPKIRNRKYGLEDSLQSGEIAFFRQKIHLQKAIVRFALNLNEIRDPHRSCDFGKVYSFRRLTCAPS
jgi:hypothetical protein